MPSIDEVSEVIVEAVRHSLNGKALGARIGAAVKERFPDFSAPQFACINLRQFIKKYVPKLVEMGRVGPDIAYAIAPIVSETANPHRGSLSGFPLTGERWKAFSNPSYPYRLLANQVTQNIELAPIGGVAEAPWVEIAKPSQLDHLEIAKAFIETLDGGPSRSQLENLLEGPKWYINFTSIAKSLGVGVAWSVFRSSRLREAYSAAVSGAGISVNRPVSQHKDPVVDLPSQVPLEDNEHSMLRRLLHSSVDEMSLADLREIRLPLGKVYDFLKSH